MENSAGCVGTRPVSTDAPRQGAVAGRSKPRPYIVSAAPVFAVDLVGRRGGSGCRGGRGRKLQDQDVAVGVEFATRGSFGGLQGIVREVVFDFGDQARRG